MIFLDRDNAFLSSDSEMAAMQVYCATKPSGLPVAAGEVSDRPRQQQTV